MIIQVILVIGIIIMTGITTSLYMLYDACRKRPCKLETTCINTSKPVEKTTCNILQTPAPEKREDRDRQVISDPLYPPLNRDHIRNEIFNQRTQKSEDRYRLVGYLVAQEDTNDSWRLFGRDTGRGKGEFYAMPSDNTKDIKVSMDQTSLRDIYSIPSEITINSPLFKYRNYTIMELGKSDLGSSYY